MTSVNNSIPSPIKSPNDKKLYRVIQLSNGLRALLISDPKDSKDDSTAKRDSDSGHVSADEALDSEGHSESEAMDDEDDGDDDDVDDDDEGDSSSSNKSTEKMAAAALCISAGSFSDPLDLQGLAHYLEHMVFMGSEKYPDENSFSAFMKKRSGSENACTDCERTIFKLEIHPKHFYEALDRLAQFFISPLMKKDSMDRELQAVDSEFNLSFPRDSCRRQLLLGSLSKEDSPLRQFMWGNSKTLKTEPEEKGIDVYKCLRDFWSRHYSAQFMTLAVQSTENLDTLEQWVTEHYSAIPNNQQPPPSFEEYKEPYRTPSFHKLYKLCPLRKTHTVYIEWALPSQLSHYKCKPLHYLGSLVGHEGRGSILALLRKKAWALGLESGNDESGSDHSTIHANFVIKVVLTDAGMDNLEEVLKYIFQYLALLRKEGPQQSLFEEMKTLQDNQFRFQEEVEAEDYVETLSEYMQLYPPEHYIVGRDLYLEYDAEAIDSCIQMLTPENANFMIMSSRYAESQCPLREKWTQMAYSVEDVPATWIEEWKNLPPNPHIHFPPPNSYIATDFDIKPDQGENVEYPSKIFENDNCRLYFKKDHKFKVPKACMYFRLLTNLPQSSAKNEVMTDLFLYILDQCLSVEVYPARIASLSYHIHRADSGIVVKLSGFNDKLPKLLETILEHLTKICSEVDPDIFEGVKKQFMKSYYNNFNHPGNLCREIRLSALVNVDHTSVQKRQALPEITLQMVEDYSKQLLSSLFVEGLIQGNVQPQEAIEVIQLVCRKLACSSLPADMTPEVRVLDLPVENSALRVSSFNKEDTNSVITNYYQSGPGDIKRQTLTELFCEIIEEPSFDTLRTKEQLGYIVSVTMHVTFGIIGFSIAVYASGDKFSCTHVDSRIECFLDNCLKDVQAMSKEEFDIQVLSLIRLKQCEDLKLTEEVDRNWCEIVTFDYVFDRLEKQVACLKALTLEEFTAWVASEIGGSRKKLSTQVVGCGHVSKDDCKSYPNIPSSCDDDVESSEIYEFTFLEPKDNPDCVNYVKGIETLKTKLPLYPVSQINS